MSTTRTPPWPTSYSHTSPASSSPPPQSQRANTYPPVSMHQATQPPPQTPTKNTSSISRTVCSSTNRKQKKEVNNRQHLPLLRACQRQALLPLPRRGPGRGQQLRMDHLPLLRRGSGRGQQLMMGHLPLLWRGPGRGQSTGQTAQKP